jgi:predicted aldo/keto reductase-like oxidoreductase
MENQKQNMDRRTFLKTTGVGGASLAIGTGITSNVLAAEAAKDSSIKTVPTRILGKSGIPVSILSLGGIDWTTQQNLLRMGFTMGATLWDTSDRYENGKSEIGIGQYFSKYPEDRKKVFICTKASEKSEAKQVSDAIDTSLKNMNTDYLDLFLLTEIRNGLGNLPSGLKEMVEKKKKEGKIKLFGFSSHLGNDKIVTDAVALGWVDALMITYNYILMQKDEVKKQVDACAKAGIGLIAIKSQGKGPDMVDTPQALEATKTFIEKGYTLEQAKLKAIWSDERIASICSNINNVTILKDNVAAATDNVKLTSNDFRMFKMLAEAESCNYCQGCGKCLTVMGEESRIPDVMRYMMYYSSYHERDRARNLYRELPGSVRNALATKDYSNAESACPHGLQIGKIMRKATSLLA